MCATLSSRLEHLAGVSCGTNELLGAVWNRWVKMPVSALDLQRCNGTDIWKCSLANIIVLWRSPGGSGVSSLIGFDCVASRLMVEKENKSHDGSLQQKWDRNESVNVCQGWVLQHLWTCVSKLFLGLFPLLWKQNLLSFCLSCSLSSPSSAGLSFVLSVMWRCCVGVLLTCCVAVAARDRKQSCGVGCRGVTAMRNGFSRPVRVGFSRFGCVKSDARPWRLSRWSRSLRFLVWIGVSKTETRFLWTNEALSLVETFSGSTWSHLISWPYFTLDKLLSMTSFHRHQHVPQRLTNNSTNILQHKMCPSYCFFCINREAAELLKILKKQAKMKVDGHKSVHMRPFFFVLSSLLSVWTEVK